MPVIEIFSSSFAGRSLHVAVASAAATLLVACATPGGGTAPVSPRAMAPLAAKSGSKVGGSVWFKPSGRGIEVVARVTGLAPNREHGFHVHETGDCSAPDATSAGGHFNPMMQPHGPQNAPHHGGDMPSLKADAAGNAEADFVIEGVTIAGGPTALIGHAVVIHAQPDDYKTQPSGNSGARIACGVIAAAPGT